MRREILDIVIIGAGTGGFCLAHGLRSAGIGVRVFERDRTPRDWLSGLLKANYGCFAAASANAVPACAATSGDVGF